MKPHRTVPALGAILLSAACLLGFASASHAANFTEFVTLNVASLIPNGNGPFSLDLQLVTGSGNVTNTVTISNFVVLGGSFLGSPTFTNGGESGNTSSSVVLTNSDPVDNEFAQAFSSGTTQISFKVTETNNAETVGSGTPVPDQFNIAILDGGLNNIPTIDPSGANTLVNNTMTASPLASQINSYTSQSPDAGVTVNAVPEPGSAGLLLFGALGLLARRKRVAAVTVA